MIDNTDAAVLAFIRTMSPAEMVTADSLLMFYSAGGDVCSAIKGRMAGADKTLQANMDKTVQLLRVAYPNGWRQTKAHLRSLRGMLNAATEGGS